MALNANFDNRFSFYYDETNNVRKIHIKEAKFNSSITSNFVLGGLVYEGVRPNITSLFDGLALQENIQDVKLRHLAKGSFIDCLKSRKLTYFLEYLSDKDVYIHYSSFNLLYWSIVDIVDSAIPNLKEAVRDTERDPNLKNYLKDTLYRLIKLECETVVRRFHKFNYPNLAKEQVPDFIDFLLSLLTKYASRRELHPGLGMLYIIFEESKKKKSLPFIEENESHILLNSFFEFYLRPIYMFKDSTHVFDHEAAIVKIIRDYRIMNSEEKIENYSFVDSESNLFIQASDILVGFIGKLEDYKNKKTKSNICSDFCSLSKSQLNNVNLFFGLVAKSKKKNPGFLFSIDSSEEKEKIELIDEIRRDS